MNARLRARLLWAERREPEETDRAAWWIFWMGVGICAATATAGWVLG